MAEEEETTQQSDLRTYSFPHSGFIPGVPGIWPGGSRVTINEHTKEVVYVWPESTLPALSVPEEQPEERVDTTQGQGEALPDTIATASNPLADAIKQLGG